MVEGRWAATEPFVVMEPHKRRGSRPKQFATAFTHHLHGPLWYTPRECHAQHNQAVAIARSRDLMRPASKPPPNKSSSACNPATLIFLGATTCPSVSATATLVACSEDVQACSISLAWRDMPLKPLGLSPCSPGCAPRPIGHRLRPLSCECWPWSLASPASSCRHLWMRGQ